MSSKTYVLNIVLLSLFVGASSLTCKDPRCKTGLCNSDGACICNLPDPSTILDGDRPFMGGKFCDEEMIMCDGSYSYWCENGGKCKEIVQGEKYRCKCKEGFGGEHCEKRGRECGASYCFNGAECSAEDRSCVCPSDWKGSSDCSLPTTSSSESSGNMTVTRLHPHPQQGSNFSTWMMVVLAISCSAAAVAVCATYVEKVRSRKDTTGSKFQQLSELQHRSMLGSDDDEANDALVQNDHSHL